MGPVVPVLCVSSRSGEGLPELWQTIASLPLRRGRQQSGPDLLRLAQETLAARFAAAETTGRRELRQLLDSWRGGKMTSAQAASALVALLANSAV
jgi:hypothetical protein